MTQSPIDRAVYDDLKDAAGAEFVAELVTTFLDDAPPMIAELPAALEAGDKDQFRRAAHSLKSNASIFGAHDLAASARDLELISDPRATPEVADLLTRVDVEFARACAELARLQNG